MRLSKTAKKGHIHRLNFTLIASFLLAIIFSRTTLALSNSTLRMFSLNNILGYNGEEDCIENRNGSSSSSSKSSVTTKPAGSQVTWIGDSYSVGAETKGLITEKLPDVDLGPGEINTAKSYIQGSKFITGNNSDNPSGLTIAQNIVDAGEMRPYLVFALGTNGGASMSKQDAKENFDKLLEIVGSDTKIVLTTAKTLVADYTNFNDAVKSFAKDHDNVSVADWAAVAKDSYYDKDASGVHPFGGYDQWVKLIYDALPGGSVSISDVDGDSTSTLIWNYFLDKGMGNNPAAIAGIIGNLAQESSGGNIDAINAFAYGGGSGIWQVIPTSDPNKHIYEPLKAVGIDFFQYSGVGFSQIPFDIQKKAILTELDSLTQLWGRYKGYEEQAFSSTIVSEETPEAYAELFSVMVEGNTPGSSKIEDSGVANHATKTFGTVMYQDLPNRKKAAREAYDRFAGGTTVINSNNNSNPTSTSNYKWKNGWLQDFEGIKKDPATDSKYSLESSFYSSDYSYNTKLNGKTAPNKITLHSTEGHTSTPDSALDGGIYDTRGGMIFPAHFTVNMKNRVIYQHIPITIPATAVETHDKSAGIQIEIMGLSTSDKSGDSDYLYGDGFSKDDWAYLVDFLYAISGETDIPITSATYVSNAEGDTKQLNWEVSGSANADNRINYVPGFKDYVGVLGHQHVPGNTHTDPGDIWSKISSSSGGGHNSSSSSSSNYCSDSSSSSSSSSSSLNGNSIAELAVAAAWPYREGEDGKAGTCGKNEQEYFGYKDSKNKECNENPKPKYEELYKKAGIDGADYLDCGKFVASVIRGGGFDNSFPKGGTGNMENHMAEATDTWEEITVKDESDLKPGDIMINSGHGQIYVGSVGAPYGNIASASRGTTVGELRTITETANLLNNFGNGDYRFFRYKGSTSSGDGSLVDGGMTLAQAKEFMKPYIKAASETVDAKGNHTRSDVTVEGGFINGGVNCYSESLGIYGGTLNNCVGFAQWFVNAYTSANIRSTTDGGQFVSHLLGLNVGLINGGKTPRPYAIFSMPSASGHGHTGVVLGIDETNNQIIIGEAGCGHVPEEKTSNPWPHAITYPLSSYTNSNVVYAYTDDILDKSKIKKAEK